MDANSILHHANELFEKNSKKPDYQMTIVNRLFIGMLHARLGKSIKCYSDFPVAVKEVERKCKSQEKGFFLLLYEAAKDSDLHLNEIDLPELSGYIKRAKQYQPEAFPPA